MCTYKRALEYRRVPDNSSSLSLSGAIRSCPITGPRKIKEEDRSAGMAKSSDVEIGGWGERFGRERTYPERAEICSDKGKKSKSAQFLRVYNCQLYVKEIQGKLNNRERVSSRYYNGEKMRDSCTSHAFPSPLAAPPRFLIADPRLGELLECDPVLLVEVLFFLHYHNARTALGCGASS